MNSASFKNAKILIVDDRESNIDILEGLLEEMECINFKSTTDALLFIDLFKSFEPDLILLDLMMPNKSGFEILDELKALINPGDYLPILVLTADISTGAKIKALSSGAKDFLSKPFDLYEVSLRIKNLLETRFLHQQIESQNQALEEKVKERTFKLEQAYLEIEKANQELKVLDRAKLGFLNLISHEIRTPLNGILGFTEILKEEIKSPKLLEYLQDLELSATKLEDFSYQALMITELRSNARSVHFQKVLISQLINSAKIQLLDKIKDKSIDIKLNISADIDSISGDPDLLQICFTRLIDIAIRNSKIHDTVKVNISSYDQMTFCEFIDNGPGYSTEKLDNLYKLFALTDHSNDTNSGLNMVLVKQIMDAHHGQISVMNKKENGTITRLTFFNQK
jgi:two-component system sensor histidine kinase/response regulator